MTLSSLVTLIIPTIRNNLMTQFIATTNKSVLVTDSYNGLELKQQAYYRASNIDAVFSVLGNAFLKDKKAYLINLFDVSDDTFTPAKLQLKNTFDPNCYHLYLDLIDIQKMIIFSDKTADDIANILNHHKLNHEVLDLGDLKSNAIEIATIASDFAQHITLPKNSRKAKQFTRSDLTESERANTLKFELTAFV